MVPASSPPSWQDALAGSDEAAFEALVQPHLPRLLDAARLDLDYYAFQGDLLPDDLTPEEVVGETLIHAWQQHRHCPAGMSLLGWLLSIQYRTLLGMAEQQKRYRREALSLDEALPDDPGGTDWFWDWQQGNHLTWDDVIGASEPVDVEIPLFSHRDTLRLETIPRHALMMHSEFEMSLPEIAFAMNSSVSDTARLLEQARLALIDGAVVGPPHDRPR